MYDFLILISAVGAFAFGIVIGWITYSILRRSSRTNLSDLSVVIGAIGGATVAGLFPQETGAFGTYCIGMAIGFFGYLIIATRPGAPEWLGVDQKPTNSGGSNFQPPTDRS